MGNYCAGNIARRSAVPKLGEGRRPLSRSLDLAAITIWQPKLPPDRLKLFEANVVDPRCDTYGVTKEVKR